MNRRTLLAAGLATLLPGVAWAADTVAPWTALRDDRVVRQARDYSCGAASVATILTEFYGLAVTEEDVLARIERNGRYSFADLAAVVETWGLVGGGIALGFDKLLELQVPAIAYLKMRGRDHFTVLRGIDPATGLVAVADPSWGNRRFRTHQFRQMWETRPEAGAEGKLLLIVPGDRANAGGIDQTFFATPGGWTGAFRTLALGRG